MHRASLPRGSGNYTQGISTKRVWELHTGHLYQEGLGTTHRAPLPRGSGNYTHNCMNHLEHTFPELQYPGLVPWHGCVMSDGITVGSMTWTRFLQHTVWLEWLGWN